MMPNMLKTDEISDLESKIRELTFLHETSQVLTATLALDDVLRSLMSQVRDYFQVEAASVALVEEESGDAVFRVAVGKAAEDVIGLRMGPGEGIVGWVVQTGQPELVPIAHSDERFYTGIDDETDFYALTMLAIPIKVGQRTIGVIEVFNPAAEAFDDGAQRLLLAVADIAAIAIRNAALYERAKRAERRYESLFDESIDPIIVMDVEGRILNLNQRVVELLNCPREQLYGADFCDVVGMGPEECRTVIQQIREGQLFRVEMNFSMQTTSDSVENELRTLETTMSRVEYDGREAIQWMGHDISEQVALERMRENLTYMIVHDLRNPLGNMMSSMQMIHDAFTERDQTVPLLQLMGIAMRSGNKLHRLIDSLLDLGRMESGEAELHKTLTSPKELIQEAVEQVQPLVLSRGQTLTTQIATDLPNVLADGGLILRVLTNLMDNAIKFTSYDGRISIGAEHNAVQVQFSVTDTGLGIPIESRLRIFDCFARLKGAEGVKGTGIGLAFCKLAVEAHAGRIWVESKEGHGATFYFTLPLEAQ